MGLRSGPLKIRLEVEGAAGEELGRRALAQGIELAREGELPDLVATLPGTGPPREPRGREVGASRLSRREREILEYLADGWSNAEIASVLDLGIRTVRFHLESLYAKLGVNRRGEAVREAVRTGLVRFDF
ncbi:MAG TPA: LuxR C-terminal-related transcriptional regulator [Rectinemataceae bacterium]|nr:LuxR C-terminal-related transcriptional regulator [Rectinemataceae bacterium]